jgi:hypothetical protein
VPRKRALSGVQPDRALAGRTRCCRSWGWRSRSVQPPMQLGPQHRAVPLSGLRRKPWQVVLGFGRLSNSPHLTA